MIKCYFEKYTIEGFNVVSAEMNNVAKLIKKLQSVDLSDFGASSIYKIRMNVTKTSQTANFRHTATSECYFYIADSVLTDRQINDNVRKQYNNICSIPDVIGKPAILTDVYDDTHTIGGLRFNDDDSLGPTEISVGKNIKWHVLDPKNDIVVDKNLHQIYPKKTGAFPKIIKKLLQKSK